MDADRALSAALPSAATGIEAAAEEALPPAGVESTSNILLAHLANHAPDAAAEFGPDLSDYSAELLWLSMRSGAKARALETLGDEAAVTPDTVSPDLAKAVSEKPALKALIRAF